VAIPEVTDNQLYYLILGQGTDTGLEAIRRSNWASGINSLESNGEISD
jgi:hypothetical protein